MLRPIGDRVLVQRAPAVDAAVGGILIPDTAKERPQEGKVVALGTGSHFSVAVGDKVIIPNYGGVQVTLAGKEYVLIYEKELLGIMR